MENEKRSFGSLIQYILLGSRSLVSDMSELALLEAQLARQSLVKLIVLAILLIALLIISWILAITLAILYLMSLGYPVMQAIGAMLLGHIVILLIMGIILSRAKADLSFPATRRQWQRLTQRKG